MARQKHSSIPDPERRQMLCDFVRQVSPEADPANILLFGLLMETRNQLAQAAEKELATVGLTWAKLRLLMHLARQEHIMGNAGVQPSELSEMQDVSRNTVSALINGLQAEGLVTRELHSSDRRKLVILKSQMGAHLKFVNQCFDVFDRPQRDTLLDLLACLNTSLKQKAEEEKHDKTLPIAQEK
jgi:DNA-binding MarR family transcriptional regulator